MYISNRFKSHLEILLSQINSVDRTSVFTLFITNVYQNLKEVLLICSRVGQQVVVLAGAR